MIEIRSSGRKMMMGLAVVVALGLVIFAVCRFNFVDKGEQDDTTSRYLVCNAMDLDNYVLTKDMEHANISYESRLIFLDDQIYRANFVVSKRFPNESSTNLFTSGLSAAYNDYVGEKDISKKLIVTTVTNVDNVGKMVVSIKGGNFTGKMAPLVMLKDAMVESGADEVQKYYEQNGFTCSVSERDMILSD